MTTLVNLHGKRPWFRFCDVYIGRAVPRLGIPASKWQNPYIAGVHGTRVEVIAKYYDEILQQPWLLADLPELLNKRLGCWCYPKACHGNVLIELLLTLP